MRSWLWRHLHLALPDDWEMLRYALDMEAGSCLFADRYQMRLEFTWKTVPGAPDFNRMMADYAARLQVEHAAGEAGLRRASTGSWEGIEVSGASAHSRYGRYIEPESCLVEAVLFWPEGRRDKALLQAVLDGIEASTPTARGLRPWAAAGLSCAVEPGMTMRACAIKPASAEMVFALPERERLIRRFQRLGMVDRWLTHGMDDWLIRNLPRDTVVVDRMVRERDGHTVYSVTGRRRRLALSLGNRWMAVASAAWRCPHDGRLYASTVERPLREQTAQRARPDRELACCQAWQPGA